MTRRPDHSMSLLSDISETALEPEYLAAAGRGDERRSGLRLGFTLAVLAALLVFAGASTTRGAGEAASERADLLQRLKAEDEHRAALEGEVTGLRAEVDSLGEQTVADPSLKARADALSLANGATAVRGPGVVVTVDDADSDATEGVVFDSDLSRLVNGLNQAGAEAIAINGRRVTALTPIRTAGSAITVDYVSLSPPYTVEAIGDPNRLEARFARTSASSWWHHISENYGIVFQIRTERDDLELPADPGMALRFARK